MTGVDGDLARTVAAVSEAGTLEAAAARLNITPSAVSQRIRAVEAQLGRPVLRRTRPIVLTDAGQAIVRFARQLELLESDLLTDLSSGSPAHPAEITIALNADSLYTWALEPLSMLADRCTLEVLRADEAHSLALLRSGDAAGAVTTQPQPAPGCSSEALGSMRYLAVCSSGFARRWLAGGTGPAALAAAPAVAFDRADDLHRQYLAAAGDDQIAVARTHLIPGAVECAQAIRLGMGWGMVPELDCADDVRRGHLVHVDPGAFLDVPLHWQRWRRASATLRDVGDALRRAAASALRR